MVRTAVAAADADEPERGPSVRRPQLEVVPGGPEIEEPQPHSFGANPLSGADIDLLPAGARHRIAAFIHLQLATLEEMPEPELPAFPDHLD
ncbi:hypothetical protein [Nocardia yamanashiensis]|uniref:hypothetical protein n=1 Tax=Nocardia yamanashiensis TaxID=209247 RepID=UPI000AB220DD|nr:hypothetical protein [Nocardia yamanashiensis]